MQGLNNIPIDIQLDWRAQLHRGYETEVGLYRLTAIRRTQGNGYQGQRIVVSVIDENSAPLAGIPVAFAYDTAEFFVVPHDALWLPPTQQAFIASTGGNGEIDQIQGSVVRTGQPGGVTVFIWDPQLSSDLVSGCGMLADHTGLHLTFQRQRVGVVPLDERLNVIEQRLAGLESAIKALL